MFAGHTWSIKFVGHNPSALEAERCRRGLVAQAVSKKLLEEAGATVEVK